MRKLDLSVSQDLILFLIWSLQVFAHAKRRNNVRVLLRISTELFHVLVDLFVFIGQRTLGESHKQDWQDRQRFEAPVCRDIA